MSIPKCPDCSLPITKHGKTDAGIQRWRSKSCNTTKTHKINSDAKHLEQFLYWLISRQRQADMNGLGRTFRRHSAKFWKIWALPSLIDEIYHVVYVDGIHLGRKAVILIVSTDHYVLGWYLARYEHTLAWANLLHRIALPDMVITDGGQGFKMSPDRSNLIPRFSTLYLLRLLPGTPLHYLSTSFRCR